VSQKCVGQATKSHQDLFESFRRGPTESFAEYRPQLLIVAMEKRTVAVDWQAGKYAPFQTNRTCSMRFWLHNRQN
jgi:hypothetical protein